MVSIRVETIISTCKKLQIFRNDLELLNKDHDKFELESSKYDQSRWECFDGNSQAFKFTNS